MKERAKCPMCPQGEVTRSEGCLDQSGATYLPTSVWSCDVCGYVRHDPAPSARWLPLKCSEANAAPEELERAAA
jgi:hypothetical protein